ncbi:hypothetical protein L9F63_025193, partial [Diploptera punctata]
VNCPLSHKYPLLSKEHTNQKIAYWNIRFTLFKSWARSSFGDCKPVSFLKDRVPILRWLPEYSWRSDLISDMVAGFTVAVMHIPQGMAYALLSTMDPIVGIYMAFFPVLAYTLFGTSRHNSMGTFAVVCLMTGKTILAYSNEESDTGYTKMQVATAIAFMVGVYQVSRFSLRYNNIMNSKKSTTIFNYSVTAYIYIIPVLLKNTYGNNQHDKQLIR